MQRSLLSKIITVGVCSAAAAGWFGLRLPQVGGGDVLLAAPLEARTVDDRATVVAQPGVRNRDAWQPSPIPSPAGSSAAAGSTGNVTTAPVPGVRNRDAWQPSPIPSQPKPASAPETSPQPLPAVIGAPPMGGVAALAGALPAPAPASGSQNATAALQPPASVDFTPLSAMFTTDRLEALFEGGLPAQRGEWRDMSFFSRALGVQTSYMVWLPPGYETSRATYPTLYLLHGVGGEVGTGAEEWLGYALTEDLDRLLALRLIEPMIVVLPNGEQGYWMNHADGGPRWADFVATDLVRHVDATFRTETARERRAIGGLSMGAHGALQIALNHPDVFSIVGAHSPTIRSFEDSPEFFGDPKWFARYDPLSLVRNTAASQKLAIWLDVGNDDYQWRLGTEQLRRALEAKKAPLSFHVLEGEHEGWYWAYYLPEYLSYYSTALHATARTPQGAPVVNGRSLATIASGISPRS